MYTCSCSGTGNHAWVNVPAPTACTSCNTEPQWYTAATTASSATTVNYTVNIPNLGKWYRHSEWYEDETIGEWANRTGFDLTPAQRAAQHLLDELEARRRELQRPIDPVTKAQRKRNKITAKARSIELLKDWLEPEEYSSLIKFDEMLIPSKLDPHVDYLVNKDPCKRVIELRDARFYSVMCILDADSEIPEADRLLAKILVIKSDENYFRDNSGRNELDQNIRHREVMALL